MSFENMSNANEQASPEYWIDMLTVSKLLEPPIGRNRLFALLREHGYLMEGNIPYQRWVDSGHFKLEMRPVYGVNGKINDWHPVTVVSYKGFGLIVDLNMEGSHDK